MNCDRCGIEIEEDIEVICSDCVTELERQVERTPLELAAEDLFIKAKKVVKFHYIHTQEFMELKDLIIKIQDNPLPRPNPPGSDVHKSAE